MPLLFHPLPHFFFFLSDLHSIPLNLIEFRDYVEKDFLCNVNFMKTSVLYVFPN